MIGPNMQALAHKLIQEEGHAQAAATIAQRRDERIAQLATETDGIKQRGLQRMIKNYDTVLEALKSQAAESPADLA